MRRIPAIILSIFCTTLLSASDYIIEVLPGKKVIHVRNLAMPDQTAVQDVLMMVPELMSRGDELFEKFDIQYNGKSVGGSRDVILVQTLLEDVERIEITTSSVSTQSNNGQSGVINIVPRAIEEGFGGQARLDGTTEWDVMPGVDLGYSKGPLELRGKLNMEYFRPDGYTTYSDITPQRTVTGVEQVMENYFQQTAKVDFKYTFSQKDVLKAWLVESWDGDDSRNISSRTTTYDKSAEKGAGWQYMEEKVDTSRSGQRSLDIYAAAEYVHTFDGGAKLIVNGGYSMNRSRTAVAVSRPHTFDATARSEGVIYQGGIHKLTMKGGVNATYKFLNTSDMQASSLYASPFCELDWNVGGLSTEATVRYQYFDRTMSPLSSGTPYNSVEHDIVASLNALWQVCPHHALRFNASRNLVRPSDMMLYPGLTYYYSSDKYVRGNPDLQRSYIHSVDLGYITDWSEHGHTVVLNVGIGYDRADGLIESHTEYMDGSSLFYQTFSNTGINNIVKANASLIYRYSLMTLTFAGNVYHNDMHMGAGCDRYTCYNLSLSPIFSFKHGWTLTSRMVYNSAVEREGNTLGDCFYAQARLAKVYRNWTFSATLSDVFEYTTIDTSIKPSSIVMSYYDLYQRYVGLGVSYRFGNRSVKIK